MDDKHAEIIELGYSGDGLFEVVNSFFDLLDAVVAGEDDLADEMVVGGARRQLVELVSEKEASLGGGEA